jgi:hypothetical protein
MKQTFLAMIRNPFGAQHALAGTAASAQQPGVAGAVRLIDPALLCQVVGGSVASTQSPYRGWSETQTESVASPYRGW